MSKSTKPAAPKNGINKPQARILAALRKAGRPVGKEALSKASGVHMNWIAEYVGLPKGSELVSELVSGVGPKKLAPAGLVKIVVLKDEAASGERTYEITASGRKALERHEREAAAKTK